MTLSAELAVRYQERFAQLHASPYMDFPAHVHMETFAQCNAACNFCPYPVLERKGAKMDDALIEKIISDLEDIPSHLGFQLSPFKISEPFLDKRLFDILEQVNVRLPNATLTLTTNASPITEATLSRLRAVKNIGYLWISFNDHRPLEYEAAMQLPYLRTIDRLNMIHKHVAAGTLPLKVVLSRVGDGSYADREFRQWVQQYYPLFHTHVFPRGNWLGQAAQNETTPAPDLPCNRWFELSVTATGIVAHCCMDGQAKWPIGDARKQHLLEIYNAPHYRQLRDGTASRLQASPCNSCNFL